MAEAFLAERRRRQTVPRQGAERILLDARRHPVVLARAFARAIVLGGAATAFALVGWPASLAAPVLLALAGLVALRAVWRWERTRVVVTADALTVVHGTVRRRSASIPLAGLGAVELEQSLLGRLLGYGTVRAGDLELSAVPDPTRVAALLRDARPA
jgi:uncharacterized membrane protein YdbT with pleckstrin-like domain